MGILLAVNVLQGGGMLLIGAVILVFVGVFLSKIRKRGKLPQKVADLARQPEKVANAYRQQVTTQRAAFGPFVQMVGSACTWAIVGSVLLLVDGVPMLVGGTNLYLLLFGLSGLIGLALAACLTITLWPTLHLQQA